MANKMPPPPRELPHELILHIAREVTSYKDLASLARLNWSWNAATTEVLYSSIESRQVHIPHLLRSLHSITGLWDYIKKIELHETWLRDLNRQNMDLLLDAGAMYGKLREMRLHVRWNLRLANNAQAVNIFYTMMQKMPNLKVLVVSKLLLGEFWDLFSLLCHSKLNLERLDIEVFPSQGDDRMPRPELPEDLDRNGTIKKLRIHGLDADEMRTARILDWPAELEDFEYAAFDAGWGSLSAVVYQLDCQKPFLKHLVLQDLSQTVSNASSLFDLQGFDALESITLRNRYFNIYPPELVYESLFRTPAKRFIWEHSRREYVLQQYPLLAWTIHFMEVVRLLHENEMALREVLIVNSTPRVQTPETMLSRYKDTHEQASEKMRNAIRDMAAVCRVHGVEVSFGDEE
jgi:hypothetical protein